MRGTATFAAVCVWASVMVSRAGAEPLPAHAARVVSYSIDVSLDAATHFLTGVEHLTWHNPSSDPVPDLWFHLYLNAFRNSNSTFIRESGGQLRGVEIREGGWGWIDITKMSIAGGADLLHGATIMAPDDGNAEDRTVLRTVLPQPVPPGGDIALDISFTARLPRVFARTGYAGEYYLVGQWFPKLGVYEPAGMRGRTTAGWNCHQFHADSEFYADYGTFDVRITTPERFVVGATGQLKSTTRNSGGTVTRRFAQDDVHDFAWTADPHFVEVRDDFVASREVSDAEYQAAAALTGRPKEEMRLSDVSIRLLMQAAHMPQSQRLLQSVRAAIKAFGLWYGRYPYPTLTIVDPAYGALGSGGMEYPTFITGGTSLVLNHWPFLDVHLGDEVAVHEFGHQFWYGLVGSNEFEEAWLDEGFTQYATGRLMSRLFGQQRSLGSLFGVELGHLDEARFTNGPARVFDAMRQPAWTYSPGSYEFYSYDKPELALETLEHLLGEPTMAKIMRTYSERWRFRHPSSDDFYAVASEVAGRDLSWFFHPVVEGHDVVDYEVSRLTSWRQPRAEGRLGTGTAMVGPSPAGDEPYLSTVVIRRPGGVSLPVTIALTYESGRVERVDWNGAERWKELTRITPERMVRAEVDPDHRVWLDANWTNNSRRAVPDRTTAATWSARVLFWVQQLVAFAGL
jgi:hypothetical protein